MSKYQICFTIMHLLDGVLSLLLKLTNEKIKMVDVTTNNNTKIIVDQLTVFPETVKNRLSIAQLIVTSRQPAMVNTLDWFQL